MHKYRAWDKSKKIIRDWTDITCYLPTNPTQYLDEVTSQCLKLYTLLRFSGYLDRHGKEIYQGHILLEKERDYMHEHTKGCFLENSNVATCDFYLKNFYQVMYGKFKCGHYRGCGFYLVDKNNEISSFNVEGLEIVGTIFENSSLLGYS